MGDETLFSYEETGTRDEIAAALRAVAAQLSASGPLTLVAGDERVTVHPAADLEFEVEVERAGEDGDADLELEFEIEWTESATADRPESTDAPPTTDSADRPGRAEATDAETERSTVDLAAVEAPVEAGAGTADPGDSQATFEVFRDRADEWRWRLVHRNGNVIATSGEGYTTRRNAEEGLRSVVENAPGADVVDGL